MSSRQIDVLGVMQRASLRIAELSDGCKTATEAELQEARAAVAELIEAQRKAHDAMLLADWNVPGLCSERQHAAYCASAAALARVGAP